MGSLKKWEAHVTDVNSDSTKPLWELFITLLQIQWESENRVHFFICPYEGMHHILAITIVLFEAAVLKNQGQVRPGSMTVSCFGGKRFTQINKNRQDKKDILSSAIQSKLSEPIKPDSNSIIGRPVSMVAKYVHSRKVDATDFLEQVRAVSKGILQRRLEFAQLSTIS